MDKNKIIVISVIIAVITAIIISIKYLPLWSTIISTIVAIVSFIGGWFTKKWWDNHVSLKSK